MLFLSISAIEFWLTSFFEALSSSNLLLCSGSWVFVCELIIAWCSATGGSYGTATGSFWTYSWFCGISLVIYYYWTTSSFCICSFSVFFSGSWTFSSVTGICSVVAGTSAFSLFNFWASTFSWGASWTILGASSFSFGTSSLVIGTSFGASYWRVI